MSKENSAIISDLESLLGKGGIVTDIETLKRQSVDYVGYRNYERFHKAYLATMPICIATPKNVAEVSMILSYLNENKINCVPKTGCSGSTGGAEAGDASTVIVDGSAMDKIVAFDEQNMLVTVQCGTGLEELENYANSRGFTTGHFPQSLPMAQLGGLTATRSIGQFSTLYGGIEDLVIGLEAVMPSGAVIKIKNVPRSATGPDLRQLFIGSEGTLAYITEISLKLFKYNAESRWMQAYSVKDMDTGLDILRQIMVNGYKPAVARLHDYSEASKHYGKFVSEGECILLFIAEDPMARYTGMAIAELAQAGGGRALGSEPVEMWLGFRNNLCDELDDNHNLRSGYLAETCEIAANWTEIGQIYKNVIARVRREIDGLVYITGHSSHSYMQGTNIYFMYAFEAGKEFEAARAKYFCLMGVILDETLKLGGTIVHHHGVGKMRTPWIKAEHGSAYLLLESLKKAFDPNGIMNRGTLLASKC